MYFTAKALNEHEIYILLAAVHFAGICKGRIENIFQRVFQGQRETKNSMVLAFMYFRMPALGVPTVILTNWSKFSALFPLFKCHCFFCYNFFYFVYICL